MEFIPKCTEAEEHQHPRNKDIHSQSTHTKRIFAGAGQRIKIQCHENMKVPAMFLFPAGMKTKL